MSYLNKLFLLFVIFSVTACSSIYDNKHVEYKPVKPQSFPVLNAIGHAPISLQNSDNETQRMLMAIKASKLAAYAELAEQVYGQQISQKTSMHELLINDHQLSTQISGVIKGAKVLKSYPVGDIYTTELTLDFKDVYDLYINSSKTQTIKQVTYY